MNKAINKYFIIFRFIVIIFCSLFIVNIASANSPVWDYLYGSQLVGVSDSVDSDGDGSTNAEEEINGTDPLSADSGLDFQVLGLNSSAVFALWETISGEYYQPQRTTNLNNLWTNHGGILEGNGNETGIFVDDNSEDMLFFRLKVNEGINPLTTASSIEYSYDSDGDGVSDWHEFLQGSSPLDSREDLPAVRLMMGEGYSVSWNSEKGKYYQVEQKISGVWINQGLEHAGTGSVIETVVYGSSTSSPEFRLQVTDKDSDGDGVSDWDEIQVGLDPDSPKTDARTKGDSDALIDILSSTDAIQLELPKPIANISTLEQGAFKISRVTGSRELIINYTISGTAVPDSDYIALSGQVTMPIGVREIILPVVPLAGSSINSRKTVYITLHTNSYDISGDHVSKIHVLKENIVNVQDYGAIGDGVNDDTSAIQSAIVALEANPTLNTLYFPSGTYLLNSYQPSTETIYNTNRILKLGSTDLANRDIIIKGDGNAILCSTASPERAHMLVAMASFRSLTVSNLVFKQSEVLLVSGTGAQGSDGVSIVRVDTRKIERIKFKDVEFNNCHGSVFVYWSAYDARGKLKRLEFIDCEILNPYGTNTDGIMSTWGGGQQVSMGAWVGVARYEGCRLEGGSADMTDHTYAPGGRLKDGGHFGAPLKFELIDSVVRFMGVESMYQLNSTLYMTTTAQGFTIPSDDGTTIVTVKVRQEDATFIPGQIIAIRTPTTGTSHGVNNIFRVVSFRDAINEIDVVNDGYSSNQAPGTVMGALLPIHLQIDDPGIIEVKGNIFEGKLPLGAEITDASGIVSNATGLIQENYITGYASGILNYTETKTPLFPGHAGLAIYKNYIRMRHQDDSPGSATYGIQTHANDVDIRNNEIACPLSKKSNGIALRGNGAKVYDNKIVALTKQVNGWSSSNRAVGVLIGNTSFGSYAYSNTTQNFDVGVGTSTSQWVIHYVEDHTSINDELGVDYRGVVPAP